MLPDGVHPDEVRELGVADADMARDALGVAVARPVAEDGRHVHDDVPAVLLEGRERGDSYMLRVQQTDFMERRDELAIRGDNSSRVSLNALATTTHP